MSLSSDTGAYAEYLNSEEWKQKRSKVRRRARGWCERCKVGARADVHHLTYERVGHEELTDLVAVCRECHEFLHGLRSKDPAAERYTKSEMKTARLVAEMVRLGCFDEVCGGRQDEIRVRDKRRQSVGDAVKVVKKVSRLAARAL